MNSTIGAIFINILPFVVVFAVFYFFMILPEKKRKKKYQTMIDELRVHDEIVTYLSSILVILPTIPPLVTTSS